MVVVLEVINIHIFINNIAYRCIVDRNTVVFVSTLSNKANYHKKR